MVSCNPLTAHGLCSAGSSSAIGGSGRHVRAFPSTNVHDDQTGFPAIGHSCTDQHTVQCTLEFVPDGCLTAHRGTETGATQLVFVAKLRSSCGTEGWLYPAVLWDFQARFDAAFALNDPDVAALATPGSSVPEGLTERAVRLGSELAKELNVRRAGSGPSALSTRPIHFWSTASFKLLPKREDPSIFVESFLKRADEEIAVHEELLRRTSESMITELRKRRPAKLPSDRWNAAIRRSLETTFTDMVNTAKKTQDLMSQPLSCSLWLNVEAAREVMPPSEQSDDVTHVIMSRGVLSPRGLPGEMPSMRLCTPVTLT